MSGFFEGRYFKQQSAEHTLALIAGRCEENAFIQAITERKSYNATYDLREYSREGEKIRIGGSELSPQGVRLDVQSEHFTLTGSLHYRDLTPLRGDIMGPFRFLPMQCRHSIQSIAHRVDGEVLLNSESIAFKNGSGYMEGDSGSSFPSAYMWVQCNDFAENCSIMASVARIPLAGMQFWGCIAVVWLNGREYRLATYHGAKIVRNEPGRLVLKQRSLLLDIEIESAPGNALFAPQSGKMCRTIRESAACPARFRFSESNRVLFEATSERASCEYDVSG